MVEFCNFAILKFLGEFKMYIVLFALWLIFNGKVTFEIVWIGLAICALLYFFICKFFGYSIKTELKIFKKTPILVKYFFVLLKEIFISNVAVMKLMFSDKKLEPLLYTFKVNLKSDNARVLLSHSITLTPGTITVELKEDEYTVHCLDKSFAKGIENSQFIRLLSRLEKET